MITSLWSGLTVGAIYAIIAIGYNITLTMAGVLNFAFANLVMIGAFIAVSGHALGAPIWIVFIVAALVCALVAVVEERVAIRFMPRGEHAELITTIGASVALTAATALIWGGTPLRVTFFEAPPLTLLGGNVLPQALVLIGCALFFGLLLHVFNTRTKLGLASLAHAADREATMLRGVNVRWMSIIAFAGAGAFAGLMGPWVGTITTASPFIVFSLAIKGFIVLYIGGIGSQAGALIGGFAIGLLEAICNLFLGTGFGEFAVFFIFLLVLLIRPQGIIGSRNRRFV